MSEATASFQEFRTQLVAMGMTQAEFASLTGCTPHRVTKWRQARRGVPGWVMSWLFMWKHSHREIREKIRLASQ